MWEMQKNQPKNLLELRNNYSKVAGCMVNIQNSLTLLCASNEQMELKLKTQYHLH